MKYEDLEDKEIENDDSDEEDFDEEIDEDDVEKMVSVRKFGNKGMSRAAINANIQNGLITFFVLLTLAIAAFAGVIVFIVKTIEVSKALNSLSCPAFPKEGWFECTSEANHHDFAKSGYIAGAILLGIFGSMALTIAIVVKCTTSKEKFPDIFDDEITSKKSQKNKESNTTCKYCGTKNSKEASHCKNCGASL